MADMPRPRLPHLHKETRHGRTDWYHRRGHGPRTRLRGDYGSPEFLAAYEAAERGEGAPAKEPDLKDMTGTLAWLITQYRQSAPWLALSLATRKQRGNIFKPLEQGASGRSPIAKIAQRDITAGMDRRAETPAQANNFLKAMRGLCAWAMKAGHLKSDPTHGVAMVDAEGEGFRVWSEEEIARFEQHWPLGTRERLAFAILLYTGLRRGDAARLGRQHVRNGVISLRTEKTGTPVIIPILPALQAAIDAVPARDLAFVAKEGGAPMTKESFGNWFRGVCDAAKCPGSAHGLRKAGATRAAQNGATERQLMAIFGWTDSKQATHYTRTADRERLAREAMTKMEGEHSIPATEKFCGNEEKKTS